MRASMGLNMRASLAALAALLAVPVTGCRHLSGYPPPAVKPPQDVLNFNTLYSANCAACHGKNGQDGPATDLANPEYEALVDDASLRKAISARKYHSSSLPTKPFSGPFSSSIRSYC